MDQNAPSLSRNGSHPAEHAAVDVILDRPVLLLGDDAPKRQGEQAQFVFDLLHEILFGLELRRGEVRERQPEPFHFHIGLRVVVPRAAHGGVPDEAPRQRAGDHAQERDADPDVFLMLFMLLPPTACLAALDSVGRGSADAFGGNDPPVSGALFIAAAVADARLRCLARTGAHGADDPSRLRRRPS